MGAPACPLTDEWESMWHLHTLEYSSAIKGKEVLTQVPTWRNLEDMMLSESHQPQKDNYCVIPRMGGAPSGQIHRDRKLNCGCRGLGEGRMGSCLMGAEFQISKSPGDGWW